MGPARAAAGTGHLLGEKRVSPGDCDDSIEVPRRHYPAAPGKYDLTDFVWPESRNLDEIDWVYARRRAAGGRPSRRAPHRQQQTDPFVPQPAQRERESAGRREVEPLPVVDCYQDLAARGFLSTTTRT